MFKLILPAVLIAALLAGCAASSEPQTASKPSATKASTKEPAATPESTDPKFKHWITKLARKTVKGTSYERDMNLVRGAVENGTGVDVYTDLYYDDEGKTFADRTATIYYNLGYTPVRVYAGNDELLLKKDAGDEPY